MADDFGKNKIEIFIEETRLYWEMNLDELLSFETSEKTDGIRTTDIEYETGEEALIDIINKFSQICDLLKK